MSLGPERRAGPLLGAGAILRLIRDEGASSRVELARRTGLARSTVAQRVDTLLARGLVVEAGGGASTGGRPATVLAFNPAAGVVLAADIGATHARLAVCDLAATPLAEVAFDIDVAEGPEAVLGAVEARFQALLAEAGFELDAVRGIGVGVPGPVDFPAGRPANPPIMPGWDGFSIPGWFAGQWAAPVLVDNDVNIMALGEHWTHWRHIEHFLYAKVGTGIGSGIVSGRAVHRGADGAAGDIGHIRVSGHDDTRCRCGNFGCLEAVAGGRALAQRLTAAGVPAASARDVLELVRSGNPEAVAQVRQAGRALGEVLAGCVNFYNPGALVIGGDIAQAQDHLLAGVREVVFQRSLPLATRDLVVASSKLGGRAGVVGAAIMAIEHLLAPEAIDREGQATGGSRTTKVTSPGRRGAV